MFNRLKDFSNVNYNTDVKIKLADLVRASPKIQEVILDFLTRKLESQHGSDVVSHSSSPSPRKSKPIHKRIVARKPPSPKSTDLLEVHSTTHPIIEYAPKKSPIIGRFTPPILTYKINGKVMSAKNPPKKKRKPRWIRRRQKLNKK